MLKTTEKIAGMVLVLAMLCPAALSQATSALLKITGIGQANTSGSVTITVNGVTQTVPFGPYSTASSVAAGFGAYFSAPPQTVVPPLCASRICAKADGVAIVFQFEGTTGTPTETWSATPNSPFGVDASQWPGGSGLVPMTLVCTPNPVAVGSTVACMAGLPAGTTGSVSFLVDDSNWQTGVALDSSGNAMVSGGLSGASQGTHMVEATYTAATGVVSTAFENVEVEVGSGSSSTVYSYSISTQSAQSGYSANGNIAAYTDSVNGTWTLGYDSLSRLTSSTSSSSTYGCWSYDSFGNRTAQAWSNQAIQAGCQPSYGATSFYTTTAGYTDGTNRITSRGTITQSSLQSVAAPGYDNVGNITTDQSYQYKYDGQGHLCAAQTAQGMVGYIYDAEGNRVAKGTITSMSCDPTANGFVVMTLYELGPNGQPMTEVDNGTWSHTDVYAGGAQVATYDGNGVHFQIHDWLGTRRVQTNYAGVVEDACSSNPYGDGQTCSSAVMDTSDLHFTGKPRDAESGLDYFLARHYISNAGRFMSPDNGSDQHPEDPQSWNLYSYVRNSPAVYVDRDGHKVQVCSGNSGLNPICYNISNGEYELAQSQDNGNMYVPSLFLVYSNVNHATGGFNPADIFATGADAFLGIVGSATYSPDGANDPAPSNRQTMSQIKQQCLNEFNQSSFGKAVNFLSPLSQFLGPDKLKSAAETDLGGYVKYRLVKAGLAAGEGGLENSGWGVIAGGAATVTEYLAETIGFPAVIAATGTQVIVHAGCASSALNATGKANIPANPGMF